MSLATRCTSCGTIFKVVQDQLKVSEGWVRCGRCNVVFNALDGLFDLEREPPPQRPQAALTPPPATTWQPAPEQALAPSVQEPARDTATWQTPQSSSSSSAAPSTSLSTAAAWIPTEPAGLEALPSTQEDDALESRWLIRPARDGLSAKQRVPHSERSEDFSDARFPQDMATEDDLDDSFFDFEEPVAGPSLQAPAALESTQVAQTVGGPSKTGKTRGLLKRKSRRARAEDTPGFVRRAERQERWRSPPLLALASLMVLGLFTLLMAQVALQYRNELNASTPALSGLLHSLCTMSGCRVEPVQRIEDLSVESATLSQPDAEHAAYRLALSLRNHSDMPLAMPYVDLVLTDTNGEVISRRAIAPREMTSAAGASAAVTAGTTQAIDLRFTAQRAVSGYTVEIFYP